VKNGIWIASRGGLRYINYDFSGSVVYTMEDGLPSNNIACLFEQGDNIWIASNISVVARFNDGKFEQYKLNTDETVVNIVGITADKEGEIWVATDGRGIIRVDGDEPLNLMKASGLESNYCQGILRDKHNNIIVLHRGGISRVWSGLEGIDVLDEDHSVDGEFSQNGVYTDTHGNIWLGMTRGVMKYIPEDYSNDSKGPAIHVVSVQVGDQLVDFSRKIDLKYGSHRFEVQYEGVSFKNGKNIRYQYILEGYDEGWSPWTKSTNVVYRKLEDGNYRFRVRACLSEDACTTSTSLVKVDIRAPFWRRWWFYLMVSLVLVVTVQLILKLRERNFKETEKYLQSELLERIKEVIQHEKELEAKNILLEQSLKQQETVLRDVHHKVKNNLQLISSILNIQAGNSKVEGVSRMLQDSQSRIDTMSLLYENLYAAEDIENISIQECVEHLHQIIADAHGDDSCKVECSIDMDKTLFDVDICLLLGMILNEIITNSYQYAFTDQVEGVVEIGLVNLDADRYKLTVGDNGVGLHKGHDVLHAKTLGFKIVNDLTQQLNGNVNCVSTEKGTKFIVTFNISA
jgi:two-component sensor histidine kinase